MSSIIRSPSYVLKIHTVINSVASQYDAFTVFDFPYSNSWVGLSIYLKARFEGNSGSEHV